MPRARPSLALGLSLVLLNLTAAVLPSAAHAAAHLHDAEHHGALVEDHHAEHDGRYSHDTDGHLHLDLQAVAANPRPDVGPAMVSEVAPIPCQVATAPLVAPAAERHAVAVVRTHDPPSAPRAPPTS